MFKKLLLITSILFVGSSVQAKFNLPIKLDKEKIEGFKEAFAIVSAIGLGALSVTVTDDLIQKYWPEFWNSGAYKEIPIPPVAAGLLIGTAVWIACVKYLNIHPDNNENNIESKLK